MCCSLFDHSKYTNKHRVTVIFNLHINIQQKRPYSLTPKSEHTTDNLSLCRHKNVLDRYTIYPLSLGDLAAKLRYDDWTSGLINLFLATAYKRERPITKCLFVNCVENLMIHLQFWHEGTNEIVPSPFGIHKAKYLINFSGWTRAISIAFPQVNFWHCWWITLTLIRFIFCNKRAKTAI